MNLSDKQIIDLIRSGDERKYALLVDRHKDKAFTLAVRIVGDRKDAEELAQDGFLRAFRNLDQFRGDAKFSTWLYRIIYNLCMTRVTRRRSQPKLMDIHDEEFYKEVFVDDELPIDEQIEQSELQKMIVEEVEKLPENYRAAVTLFYLQEMSYDEMCHMMNLPLGTVKTNLFRGRNLLRQRMELKMKGELA